MTLTCFFDMCSGGSEKTDYKAYYFEAPEIDAIELFMIITGLDPDHVTCDCCGADFSYSEGDWSDRIKDLPQEEFLGVRYWREPVEWR